MQGRRLVDGEVPRPEAIGHGSADEPTATIVVVQHGLARVSEAREGRRENG